MENKSGSESQSAFIHTLKKLLNFAVTILIIFLVSSFVMLFFDRSNEYNVIWRSIYEKCNIFLLAVSLFNMTSMIALKIAGKDRFSIGRFIFQFFLLVFAVAALMLNIFAKSIRIC